MISASASAKIILFGEHAVVYGQPAIATPLSSLRATVIIQPATDALYISMTNLNRTLSYANDSNHPFYRLVQNICNHYNRPIPRINLTITSDIPIASGLGSGAAISTAIVRALAQFWRITMEEELVNQFVFEVENIFHGTSSGLDNSVIVYEKPMYYVRNKPIEPLINQKPLTILIADSGIQSVTHEAVNAVGKLYQTNRDKVSQIISEIGNITYQARTDMAIGNWKNLGVLMIRNHELLKQLTVSSRELDDLVNTSMSSGAYGAKLSGGGRGGNMIALVDESNATMVKKALLSAGAKRVIQAKIETTI